ncbi:uncharacterized protein LOC126738454 isoform X3 [Anthonomus grandis grandis]|uniref:uncharacterized protein LOC126738454 isoform X3 n=1 Tax=Anthonomus grandis grandis TaxID=2921223 RepID=UPI002166A0C9|nr:uncharacterized protein LOC126738454 isoform X3 [Anthonomus grandis grandis]
MGMDQFVTTYRKDYLWPYVKTLGLRPHPEHLFQPQYRDAHRPDLIPCECHNIGDHNVHQNHQRNLLGPQAYEEEAWSRLGPMGPLLDPKIYPAKVSSAPQTQVGRFNQPNVFLAKIQEKYPFIYECLRTAPPDDLLARINRDRLRSTYQVDFCKMKEIPWGTPMQMIRGARNDISPPCPEPSATCGYPCKPKPRNKAIRLSTITKQFVETSMPRTNEKKVCAQPTESPKPERLLMLKPPPISITTYQDTIGKSANQIMTKSKTYHF